MEPGLRRWFGRATRGRTLGAAAGLVFVSHELADRPRFRRFGKPHVVLSNGYDLRRCDPVPRPDPSQPPRLAFIGLPGFAWHGVDKIAALARRFDGWPFDLIGPSRADVGGTITDNITIHGSLRLPDYEKILATADVGLGTLALHRHQMEEASPLKVREYLAFGIPAIIGYRDTDFPDDVPFMLRLSNTPDNVETHAGEIARFVEEIRGTRVPRSAIAQVDVTAKETRRLHFFCRW